MPRCWARCSGDDVGDVAAVEPHDAALGHREPADHAQHRRLARAVRAEQRDASRPCCTSKLTSNSTCTGPYEKSMFASCSSGTSRALHDALAVLLLLLEQLLDDEREVVADEARAVHQQQAADDARRARRGRCTVPRTPIASVRKPEITPPHEAADEEDVHRRHRGAHAAEAVRAHRLQHRADHRERATSSSTACGIFQDHRTTWRCARENCSGVKQRRRQDEQCRRARAPWPGSAGTRGRSTGRRTAGTAARRCPTRLRMTPRSSTRSTCRSCRSGRATRARPG